MLLKIPKFPIAEVILSLLLSPVILRSALRSTSSLNVPVVPDIAPLLTKDPVVVTPVANISPSELRVTPDPTFNVDTVVTPAN